MNGKPTRLPADADLRIEHVPVDVLRPDPANPRRISDEEMNALTRSMHEFGLIDPIVARREDSTVIGGHQRLIAARRLGLKTVPVIYLDLSVEQARLLNVTLNKISGDWDKELLARLLDDLSKIPDVDLSLTGFADDEIAKLLKGLEVRDKEDRPETFDVDAALQDAEARPVAKPGDLWLLGDHRLLCGDSTDAEATQRLMAGEKAALMATDPPYLVDYRADNHLGAKPPKPRAKDKDKHWDDFLDPETAVAFFKNFLAAAIPHFCRGAATYQWHAFARQALVQRAWEESGLLVHQQIIWAKNHGVLSHGHYLWAHEPCFYGWLAGNVPKMKPPANQTTVWQIDHGQSLNVHPTQKPLELFQRPMAYHTEPGDICLDPFLGSGTTLIAAERLSRRCYAIEQAPKYVDVAVRRWEAFTGGKAEKAE